MLLACGKDPPGPQRLAVERTPTRVGAWAGTVLWSRLDPATRAYTLVKSVDGRAAVRVRVPPRRKEPFDIDLGTGASGETYAVYTRRGDIYSLNVQTAKETRLDGLNSRAQEREPSIMGGRVAFVRNGQLWMGDMSGAAPRRLGRQRYVQTAELGVGYLAYVEDVGSDFNTDRVRIRNPRRIIRYFIHGSRLAYAQGSPDYGSTAWAGRALGVATARSNEHIDDTRPSVVGDACGYEHEHYCRVELTGRLKYGIDPGA